MWGSFRRRVFAAARRSKTIDVPARAIPLSIRSAAQQIAAELQVDPRLHPADFILWAIVHNRGEAAAAEIAREYFEGGRSTAVYLKKVLERHLRVTPRTILDFAGGYSRVARHFSVVMPETAVTVSDIHDKALKFARQLGLGAHASSWRPERFKPGRYDAVVAVSFLTHMPRETWANWLGALGEAVAPDGVLLVTTHGVPALEPMGLSEVDPDGFGYYMQSEQADLALDKYASTVTLPIYVQAAAGEKGLDIISFEEGGFGYQDLWIMRPKPARGRR